MLIQSGELAINLILRLKTNKHYREKLQGRGVYISIYEYGCWPLVVISVIILAFLS